MKILEEIGLTKTESKIYLALLKLGQTTTTNIVREAGIHASKVYEFLDKLIQKGLVSYVMKSNKKYFSAANPESLKEFLKEKENKLKEQGKEIDKILPQLKAINLSREDVIQSETYEGLGGLKSVYEKSIGLMGKGDTHYILGAPRVGNELLEGYLLDWHKRRIKKGIKCKYIYDSNVKDYGKVREEMPFSEVKYLPKEIVSPMWIEIFENYVAIGHIKGTNVIMFLIHDKEIARGYLDYFNLIWKISKNQ